jgi:hypothetical protein
MGDVGDDRRIGFAQSAIQVEAPHHHRELGPRVGTHRRPFVVAQMHVVEVQGATTMRLRSDVDDLRADAAEDEVRQSERAEQIGADRLLEPVDGFFAVRSEHARVVDQDVDVPVERIGEGAHRRQVGKVDLRDGRRAADLLCALRAEIGVAHRHDHVRARLGQCAGGAEADPVGRTGHDDALTCQVAQPGRCPLRSHWVRLMGSFSRTPR